jgi:radical SAM superfamily enzyme YgiQ (UPF0313 family)
MNVLLVQPNLGRVRHPVPPLGLCQIASALKANVFAPRILDLALVKDPRRELARAIEDWLPVAVGLSVPTLDNGDAMRPRPHLPQASAIAREIRSLTDVPLVVGGPAVSVAPHKLVRRLEADYAIVGEGEQAMVDLLSCLNAGGQPSELAGVCTRQTYSKYRVSPTRVENLDEMPFARVAEWVSVNDYLRRGAWIPVQSKRGCQFECMYCTYPQIEGSEYRTRNPDTVAAEMWETKSQWKVGRFEIVDATLNHPADHALALCEAIIQSRVKADLRTSGLHPASASRELLAAMKRAGFTSVVCAADSGDESMLARMGKGFAPDQIAETARWAREADLRVGWSFVFGGPGETEQTLRSTIRFMRSALGPRDRILSSLGLRVYPGTELAETAVDDGAVAPGADLVEPAFYFSPKLTPYRVLSLLESAGLRSRVVHLSSLPGRGSSWGARLRRALRLPRAF